MTGNRHHVRTPFAPPDPLPPHLKYALPIMLRSHHSASLIPSLRSKSVHIAFSVDSSIQILLAKLRQMSLRA